MSEESYSKEEIDLKIALANEHTALIEERLEHKFTQLLSEIKSGFHVLHRDIAVFKQDLAWLKGLLFVVLGLLLGLLFKH